MPGLPIYEGRHDQVLDGYPTAEPMGRKLDSALPTPDHAVGTTGMLEIFDGTPGSDDLVAHASLIETVETAPETLDGSNMPGVAIRYI